MITATEAGNIYDIRGLSTDTKPTLEACCNGSTFLCLDTGTVYIYNGTTKTWVELQ